jgi:hypothetical protein
MNNGHEMTFGADQKYNAKLISPSESVGIALGNLGVWSAAVPALRVLAAADIPVIVFKSLPQIEALYGHPGGRPTTDVDIIVHAVDAARTIGTLQANGWQLMDDRGLGPRAHKCDGQAPSASLGPWALSPPGGSTALLDVHSDGAPGYLPIDRTIWARAHPSEADGAPFLALSNEDRFIVLCWHVAMHGLDPERLEDTRRMLLLGLALDWQLIITRCRTVGISGMVKLVCETATRCGLRPLRDSIAPLETVEYAPHQRLVKRLLPRADGRLAFLNMQLVPIGMLDKPRDMILPLKSLVLPHPAAADYSQPDTPPNRWEYTLLLFRCYGRRLRNLLRLLGGQPAPDAGVQSGRGD